MEEIKAFWRKLSVNMQAEIGKSIEKAASMLCQGNIVAMPTETVYGLEGLMGRD